MRLFTIPSVFISGIDEALGKPETTNMATMYIYANSKKDFKVYLKETGVKEYFSKSWTNACVPSQGNPKWKAVLDAGLVDDTKTGVFVADSVRPRSVVLSLAGVEDGDPVWSQVAEFFIDPETRGFSAHAE